MVENKMCSLLPLENLRAIQCMRRVSLPRSVINSYKYQNKILKTYYFNLNHIEEVEMDAQDKLIIDNLTKQGKIVFHIFHSRGMVEYALNEKDWMMRRAYVFINRLSNDTNINSTNHDEIRQGVLDAFIICEPINIENPRVLAGGIFSQVSLSKIRNLQNQEKVFWGFDRV